MGERDPAYEDIGYEAAPPQIEDEEVQIYNAYELSRLNTFAHILRMVSEVEENISDGTVYNYVWKGEDKKSGSVIMPLDRNYLRIWREKAFNEYAGNLMQGVIGLMHKEHLKEAADFVLDSRKAENNLSKEFEKRELQAIWERY